MAQFLALPGTLDISLTVGDEFGMRADLSIDTTGFTWTAIVYQVSTSVSFANPAGVTRQVATAATFAVKLINAAAGQVKAQAQAGGRSGRGLEEQTPIRALGGLLFGFHARTPLAATA